MSGPIKKVMSIVLSLAMVFSLLPAWTLTAEAAGPEAFTTDSFSPLPESPMADVAYGNGVYVAVGHSHTILKSADADTWEIVKSSRDSDIYEGGIVASNIHLYGVAFGNGIFVAGGTNGIILTSADGVSWTQQTSGISTGIDEVEYLTFNGEGAFYALTKGGFIKSTDGTSWTSVIPTGANPSYQFTEITVGENGAKLVLGESTGTIFYTTDGVAWSSARPNAPVMSSGINILRWVNDRYFISDPHAYFWTSSDLSSFELMPPPFKQTSSDNGTQLFQVLYDGSRYYLFGTYSPYSSGCVLTSTDASNWTMQPYTHSFTGQNAVYVNGTYFRLGNEGMLVSSDGENWNYKWGGTFYDIVYDGSMYIAAGRLGDNGAIWTSPDRRTWTQVSLPSYVRGLCSLAYGDGKYVALSDTKYLLTSANGTDWAVLPSAFDSVYIYDLTYQNGVFVVVGTNGSYTAPVIRISSDGTSWNEPSLPSTTATMVNSVTWINNQFVAVGYGNDPAAMLWTSPDGSTWTDHSAAYPVQSDALMNIVYDGSKYILMGQDADWALFTRISSDLNTWSASAPIPGSYTFEFGSQMEINGSTLYALTMDEDINIRVYYSGDQGATWQDSGLTAGGAMPVAFSQANGYLLIGGHGKLVMSAAAPAITATLTPAAALTEENLNANSLSVTLSGTTFADASLDKASFTLNNAPSGLTVDSVTYTDDTHCTLTLAYGGADFDSNVTNFSLTIAAVELSSGTDLTSGALTITATVETVPTVVTGVISATANGTYKAGQDLGFTVHFNEIVTVDSAGGTPFLELLVGSTARQAVYDAGSGTSTLAFLYTIQAGDLDADGISLTGLSLNGGAIRDAAGNDAQLTLNGVGSTAGILVDAVAPVITANSLTVDEGADAVIDGGELSATDTGNITYIVTALPVNGTLKKDDTQLSPGGTFTQADIDSSRITYTHNGGEATADSFTFSVSDGVNTVSSQTFSITVTPVNDAPMISAPASISVTEDNTKALTGITFSDADAGSGEVTATFSVASGALSASSGGGVAVDGTACALTLTGALADINAFIAASQVTYAPALNANGAVTLTVAVNDNGYTGGGGPKTASTDVTLNIAAINDAPTLGNASISLTGTNEDQVSASTFVSAIVADANIQDADPGDSLGIAVTAATGNGNWEYSLDGAAWTNIAPVSSGAALLLSPATRLRYVPDGINGEIAVLTYRAWDQTLGTPSTNSIRSTGDATTNGGSSAFSTAAGTARLNVSSVNDAPVLTAGGGATTYTENASATEIDGGITVSDPDDATLASATVSITGNFQSGQDVLAFTNDGVTMGNIAGSYDADTGVLTLSAAGAAATLAQWQAALRAVTYENSSSHPSTVSRTVTFVVNDAMAASAAATKTVTITPVNDAPVDISLSVTSAEATATGPNAEFTALSATDPDDTSGITYTLAAGTGDTDNSLFNISGASLRTNGTMPSGSHSIRVRATDSEGLFFEKAFTLTVTGAAAIGLTADTTDNSADNNLEITFTSNSAFENAITGVSFNGQALTVTTDYIVASGKLTLKPDGGNPALCTPAAANVIITAAGYAPSAVSQTITAGAASSLEITTQPVPGEESGAAFATQPEVTLKDRYGNVCADGPSASAAVTASALSGTGVWTLGETAAVTAENGVAAFAGLTCAWISTGDGKIQFTSASFSVDSDAFVIPEPNSSIAPQTASFDRYAHAAGYTDIAVALTLNGNTLTFVKNGASALLSGADYTVSDSTLTLRKEYLKTLGAGAVSLTFSFSHGLDRTLVLTISDTTPASDGSDNSPPPATAIEVNGQKQDAGTSSTQTIGGQTVTTITVDNEKLDKILESSGEKPTVTLPAGSGSDAVIGELNGQTVKAMEQKEATLEIKTGTVIYTLPAAQINIDTVSAQLGAQVELGDIKVSVKITEPPADTVKIINDTASRDGYQLIVQPVTFEITCTSGDKTVQVNQFNGYVERTIAIPAGVDPSKITTGIVLNADGTFRHVPTEIVVINATYYAKINSLTNSTYSVIYHPVAFMDMASHWAGNAVNNMGSRLVVTGMGNNSYEPDRSITRAEFAAITVRALGLAPGTAESGFGDVSLSDWFNGYVDTASVYSLITGYANSTAFGPNDLITREQAMAILARAMKLTRLGVNLTDSEAEALLAQYADGTLVSGYAKNSVAACIKAGIVRGTTEDTLSPKAYVTRAEVAIMAERLLLQSGLI